MHTEFNPETSGNGTKFYLHLANWSEFFSWFSTGVALSFLVQLVPKLMLLYPLAFVFALAYFILSLSLNRTANLLRIAAVVCSLVGFWNLIYLYRDMVSTAAMTIIILLALGGLVLWLKR